MHPAKEGFAALPFFDEFDLSTVDILLISQYVNLPFPFPFIRRKGDVSFQSRASHHVCGMKINGVVLLPVSLPVRRSCISAFVSFTLLYFAKIQCNLFGLSIIPSQMYILLYSPRTGEHRDDAVFGAL